MARAVCWLPNGRADRERQQRQEECLELIRLQEQQNVEAGSLSHGAKQWLEIGMLLMQDPDLLLLDEPAAGMTDDETTKDGRDAASHRTAEIGSCGRARHGLSCAASRTA
jgi:ABC-type uncharacterized transport system ATPase subunit